MNENRRSQGLFTLAVGAGVVIGAFGLFLYECLFKEKRRLILQQHVSELGINVSELRREVEEIRDAQRRRSIIREEEASISSVSERTPSTLNESENETISTEDEFPDHWEFEDRQAEPRMKPLLKIALKGLAGM